MFVSNVMILVCVCREREVVRGKGESLLNWLLVVQDLRNYNRFTFFLRRLKEYHIGVGCTHILLQKVGSCDLSSKQNAVFVVRIINLLAITRVYNTVIF